MTPDKHTLSEQYLDVGDGHQLYIQDWGNKDAKTPIIFLHGGPGGGVKDRYRQQFEPSLHRVIFFDQRGSGKSLPYGSLEHNTTDHLINDLEKIISHFKLAQVILTGGSWGSCLALAFAIKNPKLVKALVLRGIFTGSQSEIDFLNKGGYRAFFPDVWDKLVAETPKQHRHDPAAYHLKQALGEGEAAKRSAYTYGNSEGALLNLDDRFTPYDYDEFDPTSMRMEMHYLANNCFLPDRYIIDNAHKLKMPVWLIQGRYDMVCPPVTAYELSQQLPDCELIWTVAGHGNDRPNYDVNRTILLQMAREDMNG